jgi:UDP-N-acetylglucosamine diphosphorylase/glucosamine-1-phosphate N-acetyltransferase
MARLIVFDDGRGQFGPMGDLRAAFEIRTGMHTNAGRIAMTWPRRLAALFVPEHIRAVVAERANAPVNQLPGDEEVLLCVNGRWCLPDASLRLDAGEAVTEGPTGHVVAAALRRADAEYLLSKGELHERVRVVNSTPERVLHCHPWDVMAWSGNAIASDILATRMIDTAVPRETQTIGDYPIEVHSSATLLPNVILDAADGPIMIHERAVIRPGAVISGPASIGHDSVILDNARIKANTVIGPSCKIAGEVGATIFQGFSNKSHDGHIGDSWVGKWVNLGAGTTNSNLLNTYGEISMAVEPDAARLKTGRMFLGAVIADHVKTAIGSRIMTGSMLATGAMIALSSFVPTIVRRFAWLTDSGESTYKLEPFLETARQVMARRQRPMSPAYERRLRTLHAQHITTDASVV